MNRISKAFAAAKAENRACFIGYLCAGDPDFDISVSACRCLIDSGVDILELGVPFSDPLADGITNQLAAQRALESGMTSARVLELVQTVREFSEIPIVFYTYYNLVFSKGSEAYTAAVKQAGVDGILTLDLPPEEAQAHLAACEAVSLSTIFIVAPTTPDSRMKTICAATTGFVYYVSREGVTGERASMSEDIAARVASIKQHTDCPVVVGFGISAPEHVKIVSQAADGVVVGSAIVNCIANNLADPKAIKGALRDKLSALCSAESLSK